jgi:multiple sugar transport system ATP-binding protein
VADVRLENVEKVYDGGVKAVQSLTLDVKDKEFVVLVGPSGCGKTTTLRMIAGLEEVTSGAIYIDGKLVNDVPPKDRDIAMVFQNYALYPHMTVWENMAFGLKLRRMPKNEIDQRVREAASILQIEHLLDRKPKALSGGQRQRVALGRAIVRKPKVFLFDEPLSNLDAKLRVQMRTEIAKLHLRLATTMIYVTHDQTEAMTMGSKIVLMKDGIVQQIDTPLRMYNHPANQFVAGFIGTPAMNFIEGSLEAGPPLMFVENDSPLRLPVDEKHRATLAPWVGRGILLGIRPEHIRRAQKGSSRDDLSVRVSADLVEPLGNELLLYFTTHASDKQRVARLTPADDLSPGTLCDLEFDMSRAHFFDPQTGKALLQ